MANLLLSGFVPFSSIHDTSGHRLNYLIPKLAARCDSASRNVLIIDRGLESQKPLQNPPANHTDEIEMDNYLSLLNRFVKKGKQASDFRQIHSIFLKSGVLDNSIKEKISIVYASNTELVDDARKMFDEITETTVYPYALLIDSYCRAEKWEDLFLMLKSMFREGMFPDQYLLPPILKACSTTRILRSGRMIHGYAIRKGLDSEIYVGNAIIDFYANCGYLELCRSAFNAMKAKDVVSWTALLSAYMDAGLSTEASKIFNSMQRNGVNPDHISWNALISGLASNGEIESAFQALKNMDAQGLNPSVRSWNGIISGCINNGHLRLALDSFNEMLCFPEIPNVVTIASILSACAEMEDLDCGRTLHGFAIKRDICWNKFLQGSLINMYSKCRSMDSSVAVFLQAKERDTTMWNGMISGYVTEGKIEVAHEFLRSMKKHGSEPDMFTYNTILSGYSRNARKPQAFRLISQMIQINSPPDTISFNALISGFQQSGLTIEALKLFRAMQLGTIPGFSSSMQFPPVKPNQMTITCALAACTDLNLGKEIHGYIIRNAFENDIFILCASVDMYMKYSDMSSSRTVFRRFKNRNTVAWNTFIAGHMNTKPEDVFKLFNEMTKEGVEPSSITLTIVLSACGRTKNLRAGKELHGHIIRSKFHESSTDIYGLINMYDKCGCVKQCDILFDTKAM